MTAIIRPLADLPLPESRPELQILITDTDVIAQLPMDERRRLTLTFSPLQAVRVTTVDCFDMWFRRGDAAVYEVNDSPWIADLSSVLSKVDVGAHFLEKSRHFIVLGGDNVAEVVSWHLDWRVQE